MAIFRIIVALLPQLLLLMLAGAAIDMLGGWNRTDSGLGVLMVLFLAAPVAATALLIVESIRHRRHVRHGIGADAAQSSRKVAFAAFILVESLAVDLLILSQTHMH